MPTYNMRFGAMAAEARNNGSANLKVPCAAERVMEAATAPSRFLVVCKGCFFCIFSKNVAIYIYFLYFCGMVERKIIAYKNYYDDFMATLSDGVRKKIHYGLDLLSTQIKDEYYASKQ